MHLFSIHFVYLSFYCIALLLAFWRTRSQNAPKSRNSVAAVIIGAVGTLLIYISSLFAPDAAAPLVLIAALVLIPICLLGIGSLLGLWIASWRKNALVQTVLCGVALGVPIYVAFYITSEPIQSQTALTDEEAALVAFQKTNITGRLGRYPVTLPASPQIDTYYACFDSISGTVAQCRARFATDPGLTRTPGEIPVFHHIHIARKSADCSGACLNFERLAEWCRLRGDLALQEWCSARPADEIELSYTENRFADAESERGWNAPQMVFEGVDVKCRTLEDEQMCRARYDIERNLQVTIWLRDLTEDGLAQRLEAAQDYVSRLWEDMQRDM